MKHFLRTTLPGVSLSVMLLAALPASAADVVTSIKPLQLITSALTDGVTEPELLLPPEGTPHHYALKPSDMRKLADARVVLWVGPGLEQFLQKPLSRTNAKIVTLLPDSTPHVHEAEVAVESHDEHEHEEHQSHVEGEDPHIWLDPLNALAIADQVLPALQQAFPDQQEQLLANRAAFEQAVRRKDAELASQLSAYNQRGFFVFHDAYSGFVNHYGLNQLGYFTVDPARKPGARHLAEIRQQLEHSKAVCVFSEPQFTSAVVNAIISGLPVRLGELDPLARTAVLGPNGYTDYLQKLGDHFVACLKEKTH
ncbi:zinc ABC transporter substrate-binding protein ZnuA [Marinobacterium marinum]|uniref:High-affinity zinc uptake system protein ZnuA n=1 Tax=Marinobacterium marinum TaxID=2756129 RepID=A0A7W1WZ83_9GAMM|nr:zinc ABC transporter substrate-binding protein ZnuA [Marinobacterium marinum]MBA4502953.1 zinc ABC transporter substrate-binding protein ZnuA [Marinobacterium marinum]